MIASKVKITDNSDLFINAKDSAVERALEAIGLQAEGYAKKLCPVDTGLLRNSITHAVSGGSPAISGYQADRAKGGEIKSGTYSGSTGSIASFLTKERAAIIGTNVEYAPYVEYGTRRTKAQPFIKPAAENHADEYKRIVESELKKG